MTFQIFWAGSKVRSRLIENHAGAMRGAEAASDKCANSSAPAHYAGTPRPHSPLSSLRSVMTILRTTRISRISTRIATVSVRYGWLQMKMPMLATVPSSAMFAMPLVTGSGELSTAYRNPSFVPCVVSASPPPSKPGGDQKSRIQIVCGRHREKCRRRRADHALRGFPHARHSRNERHQKLHRIERHGDRNDPDASNCAEKSGQRTYPPGTLGHAEDGHGRRKIDSGGECDAERLDYSGD